MSSSQLHSLSGGISFVVHAPTLMRHQYLTLESEGCRVGPMSVFNGHCIFLQINFYSLT